MSKVKKCLECGKVVVGRSDKKYCDVYCRNEYNNRLNSDTSKLIRNVNYILKKNRRVLVRLKKENKIKCTKERLIAEGFNFSYFTNKMKTSSGAEYYFCYDQGLIELENNYCQLVLKGEETNH